MFLQFKELFHLNSAPGDMNNSNKNYDTRNNPNITNRKMDT